MRTLEHRVARARLAARRLRARLAPRDPSRIAPARLVLDLSSPSSDADLAPAALRRLVVEAVDWRGPLPVTLELRARGDHPFAEELIRFAHRLECPTRLVVTGPGLDAARCKAFVDRGLEAIRLVVAGREAAVQEAVLGTPAGAADAALQAMVEARSARRASLDIEVGLHWSEHAPAEAEAVSRWAARCGADGIRLLPPHDATGLEGTAAAVDGLTGLPGLRAAGGDLPALTALLRHGGGAPGLPRIQAPGARRWLPCPVGGQRLAVDATGQAACCPHKAPIGRLESDLGGLWAQAGPHLADIRKCDRVCVHVELCPEPWAQPALATGPRIE
ncbi:MAG: hypothetical protein VX265_13255 [Myxococcota bacterium]|nr:hypothetical protein [Myxococcota bacterium]